MPRIQQLDTGVVNKIAAGEVIERPANAVKELLENSIDALATRVEVDIAQGGSELIRVVDDGEGIHPDDLQLTVSSHATSKINSADDLFNVRTMGFRGEALASIAEVSRFRIRSRQADCLEGVELEVNCGRRGELQPCGCPVGTLIEIRQLFANTPVRRKFMKTAATEFGHISEQFTRIGLANPRLHMVLRHNQRTVYELPATNQLRDRIALFFGNELAEHLFDVESEMNDVRMWGYVAHPSQSKSTRKGQYIFLNGRWIQDRTLQHALREAYRGLMMVGRQPITFLFLEMPPDLVDVNVHPTKVEVRFRDSQQLYRQLLHMLRDKFQSLDLDSDLRVGSGAKTQRNATVDTERQLELQRELSTWAKSQISDQTFSHPTTTNPAEGIFTRPSAAANPNWNLQPTYESPTASNNSESSEGEEPEAANYRAAFDREPHDPSLPNESSPTEDNQEAPTSPSTDVRAMQVHDCYLIVETPTGIILIDQHALHERILYEGLRERILSGSIESQRMLIPETVELSPQETALLMDHAELLAQLGFGIEEFGKNTVLLNGYPVMLAKANLVQLVRDIADQLAGSGNSPTHRDLIDELLHMMSCKAAIKAGHRLSSEEMESLLAQRHLVDDAHHCPHGRPTAMELSRAELDRQFGRLG